MQRPRKTARLPVVPQMRTARRACQRGREAAGHDPILERPARSNDRTDGERAGEEEAAGRAIAIDGGLQCRERLRHALDLVERDVGAPGCIACVSDQRALPTLARSGNEDDRAVLERFDGPASRQARDERAAIHAGPSQGTASARCKRPCRLFGCLRFGQTQALAATRRSAKTAAPHLTAQGRNVVWDVEGLADSATFRIALKQEADGRSIVEVAASLSVTRVGRRQ